MMHNAHGQQQREQKQTTKITAIKYPYYIHTLIQTHTREKKSSTATNYAKNKFNMKIALLKWHIAHHTSYPSIHLHYFHENNGTI